MPGLRRAASDIEQSQEELANRSIGLEANRLEAVVEAYVNALPNEGPFVLRRERHLVLEIAIKRRDSLIVVRINRDTSTAKCAQRWRRKRFQASRNLADDGSVSRTAFPVYRQNVNPPRAIADQGDIVLADHGTRRKEVCSVDHIPD